MPVNLVNAKKGAAASVTNCLKKVDADVNKVSAKVDAAATLTNSVTMSDLDRTITQRDVSTTQNHKEASF